MNAKNQAITGLSLLLLIILISQTASAATYTFNHAKCAIEDSSVCLCDDYDSATDTCTITTDHTYRTGGTGDDITLNYDNIILNAETSVTGDLHGNGGTIQINTIQTKGTGSLTANGGLGGNGGSITINSTILKISTIRTQAGTMVGAIAGAGGTITIESDTIEVTSILSDAFSTKDGGTITITANEFICSGTISAKGGTGWDLLHPNGNGGTISIKASETINISSSITTQGSTAYIPHGPDGPITIETCKIRTTNNIKGGTITIRYCEELEGNNFINVFGSISEDVQPYSVGTCLGLYQKKPAPTLISLQGTVTDTDNKPINGTVTVTSLEKCADTTCAAKTPTDISAATNDASIKDGIVNTMLGPYNLILATTYTITIKVCDLTGLCDENIELIFNN